MANLSDVLDVYDDQNEPVAQVVLNGYSITQGGPFGRNGTMVSFQVVEGDLYEQWDEQRPLSLHSPTGPVLVRVLALPVEEDSFGLLEFLQ